MYAVRNAHCATKFTDVIRMRATHRNQFFRIHIYLLNENTTLNVQHPTVCC